jgi:hypothetical protein
MKREEQWEVWGCDGVRWGTGETRETAILDSYHRGAQNQQPLHNKNIARWIRNNLTVSPSGECTVHRVTYPEADKLIARMADFELQLMAMRDDLIEELNR